MTNLYRKIGGNIYAIVQKEKVSPVELASAMSYSLKDIWNVIEGKVMLPPAEIKRVAYALNASLEELVDRESSVSVPDKVLDLIDEYIEIRESIGIIDLKFCEN